MHKQQSPLLQEEPVSPSLDAHSVKSSYIHQLADLVRDRITQAAPRLGEGTQPLVGVGAALCEALIWLSIDTNNVEPSRIRLLDYPVSGASFRVKHAGRVLAIDELSERLSEFGKQVHPVLKEAASALAETATALRSVVRAFQDPESEEPDFSQFEECRDLAVDSFLKLQNMLKL